MTVEASHPKGRSGSVWGCVKMLTLHIDKSSKTTVSNEHHFIGRKPRLVKYNHLARDNINISTYAAYIYNYIRYGWIWS